jgi:hypothetical protein
MIVDFRSVDFRLECRSKIGVDRLVGGFTQKGAKDKPKDCGESVELMSLN